MNLGESIKSFRKQKGLSQKELAEKSGISANAMCSIENDNAFPSKSTIKSICNALSIPTSLLLFASLTDEDIPEDKLIVFKALQKPILELFNQDRI
jgi:transcriptional regulator with XRE-family HTH domain